MFTLMSNGIFQVYESSKEINKIMEISDKGQNLNIDEAQKAIFTVKNKLRKGIYKLNSVGITAGIICAYSILTGLGVIYSPFAQYALIGLPFWILFNLKFNRLSHGYYFVLLSLVLF